MCFFGFSKKNKKPFSKAHLFIIVPPCRNLREHRNIIWGCPFNGPFVAFDAKLTTVGVNLRQEIKIRAPKMNWRTRKWTWISKKGNDQLKIVPFWNQPVFFQILTSLENHGMSKNWWFGDPMRLDPPKKESHKIPSFFGGSNRSPDPSRIIAIILIIGNVTAILWPIIHSRPPEPPSLVTVTGPRWRLKHGDFLWKLSKDLVTVVD